MEYEAVFQDSQTATAWADRLDGIADKYGHGQNSISILTIKDCQRRNIGIDTIYLSDRALKVALKRLQTFFLKVGN